MTLQQVAFAFGVATFLLVHLCAAIWFASKVDTKVKTISDTLGNLTADVKAFIGYDAKIQVLHERINNLSHRIDKLDGYKN